MSTNRLEETVQALLAPGKGILAADETVGTISKRFESLGIVSTEESQRTYRELLFSPPGLFEFISGVILYDETIRQKNSRDVPLADAMAREGIIPGIKVDTGAKPLAGCPDEKVTEGLDGLRERLEDYRKVGARFAKWRAVILIKAQLPSETCIDVNAHDIDRYADNLQGA